MTRCKIVYIGGGSTRAPGTVASFLEHGEGLAGSEVVLVDLDESHLRLVETIGQKMARARGIDISVTATTDRRAALTDADMVLTSFRPGGFEARVIDETVPLRHGVIGQETQGPGGFFMALRSIAATQEILADLAAVAPKARIVNYTNPVNIVAQAVADHSDVPIVSLCEGPIIYPRAAAVAAGLDPELIETVSVGLNHGSWSVVHRYDGEDTLIDLLRQAWERRRDDPTLVGGDRYLLQIAATLGTIGSEYFQYYYFEREVLARLQAASRTRAQTLVDAVPGYWAHYAEQAEADSPILDPDRSRGGIFELDLAIDVIDAVVNDLGVTLPVNTVNRGSVPGLPDSLVVETVGRVDSGWVTPIPQPALPPQVRGITEALAEYQLLAAEAGWSGTRIDGVRALVSHPFVRDLDVAERLYDEMAHAHRDHLPARLLR